MHARAGDRLSRRPAGRRRGGSLAAGLPFALLLAVVAFAALVGVVTEGIGAPTAPSSARAQSASTTTASPLVGVNYTNYDFPGCSFEGTGILRTLGRPGPAAVVGAQLRAMRTAGAESLRLLVWFTSATDGQSWGVVGSADGVGGQFAANLARFVGEVRADGFERLTVAFGPRGPNSPLQSDFDPGLLGQDWRFIAGVRRIVVADGPGDIRFDLLNEGAPSRYQRPAIRAQLDRYLVTIYGRYVRTFGHDDVTVSAVGASSAADRGDRLENLVALLRGAHEPLPTFFDVHANFGAAGVGVAVADAERQLAALGVHAPLVIGETAYDDPGVARTLKAAVERDPGAVEEVDEWFLRVGRTCPVDPPYSVAAYLRALGPAPTPA